MNGRFLLDTNIIVEFVRDSETWRRIRHDYGLFVVEPTPLICFVSQGELRSLAKQWAWGGRKLAQLRFCFAHFGIEPIEDDRVVEAYAMLDAYAVSEGVTIGKNDLWIAATAVVTGATLLTTDQDFDLFAPRFLHRLWLDPNAATT